MAQSGLWDAPRTRHAHALVDQPPVLLDLASRSSACFRKIALLRRLDASVAARTSAYHKAVVSRARRAGMPPVRRSSFCKLEQIRSHFGSSHFGSSILRLGAADADRGVVGPGSPRGGGREGTGRGHCGRCCRGSSASGTRARPVLVAARRGAPLLLRGGLRGRASAAGPP